MARVAGWLAAIAAVCFCLGLLLGDRLAAPSQEDEREAPSTREMIRRLELHR